MFLPRLSNAARLCALVGLAVAAFTPAASAESWGLHIASKHIPAKRYNNSNPGAYYRSDDNWTIGAYHNSLRRNSVYAGYTLEHGRFGVTMGGVTGYDHAVQPLFVPTVSLFTVQGVTARIAFIPRVEKRIGSHVLHLMLEF
ncbi:hypothetical protein [Rhizobacter sp. SG703]|uniref:hypothetical protein n=1 Tax=Rhizobacter sp. SG703 TaxID=2587140 RepID=UPI00144741D2|nr:hypothetical protein [Rhizobacter sp. SG703]NKI94465.1 hypothetical protein [Rhizobacter sp. SG703]